MKKESISEIRKKPGESNAGKYTHVKPSNFAGPHKTYPINNLSRAKAALSYAHYSKNPSQIQEKVYQKYPGLAEKHEKRKALDAKKFQAYRSR